MEYEDYTIEDLQAELEMLDERISAFSDDDLKDPGLNGDWQRLCFQRDEAASALRELERKAKA